MQLQSQLSCKKNMEVAWNLMTTVFTLWDVYHVVWQTVTDISEECAGSVLSELSQHIPYFLFSLGLI